MHKKLIFSHKLALPCPPSIVLAKYQKKLGEKQFNTAHIYALKLARQKLQKNHEELESALCAKCSLKCPFQRLTAPQMFAQLSQN